MRELKKMKQSWYFKGVFLFLLILSTILNFVFFLELRRRAGLEGGRSEGPTTALLAKQLASVKAEMEETRREIRRLKTSTVAAGIEQPCRSAPPDMDAAFDEIVEEEFVREPLRNSFEKAIELVRACKGRPEVIWPLLCTDSCHRIRWKGYVCYPILPLPSLYISHILIPSHVGEMALVTQSLGPMGIFSARPVRRGRGRFREVSCQ